MSYMEPKISVVMPLYMGDKYVSAAIESILNQTFRDFELLIICDDPSDKTKKILDKYKAEDFRVRPFYQKRRGLVESLNRGMNYSKGKYIVRMDADDISMPKRLEKQFKFMEKNQDVGVCGTNIRIIDENGMKKEKIYYPSNDRDIKANLFFNSALAHPSVIIRKDILDFKDIIYDSNFKHAEDYELWVRLSIITKFANIKEALLLYRVHCLNVGKLHTFDQNETANVIRKKQLISDLKLDSNENEFELHFSLCNYDLRSDMSYLINANNWLIKVRKSNEILNVYPEPEFSYVILERFVSVCNAYQESFIVKWKFFFKSCLSKDLGIGFMKKYLFKYVRRITCEF